MDNEELLKRIEELESRIDELEQKSCEECEDMCPECGQSPCVCDETETEVEDTTADDIPSDDELGEIDNDDVEQIEELDFNVPNFDAVESDEDEASGLYDYGSEDEEDSPYYN